jgi:hypothetical protein
VRRYAVSLQDTEGAYVIEFFWADDPEHAVEQALDETLHARWLCVAPVLHETEPANEGEGMADEANGSSNLFWVARTRPHVRIVVPSEATLFDLHLAVHAELDVDEGPEDHLHQFTDQRVGPPPKWREFEPGTDQYHFAWEAWQRSRLVISENHLDGLGTHSVDDSEWSGYRLTSAVKLSDLGLVPGDRLIYAWDLGSTITVELIYRGHADSEAVPR